MEAGYLKEVGGLAVENPRFSLIQTHSENQIIAGIPDYLTDFILDTTNHLPATGSDTHCGRGKVGADDEHAVANAAFYAVGGWDDEDTFRNNYLG